MPLNFLWTMGLKRINDITMVDPFHTIFSTRGAVTAVAEALDISLAAVSQWRKRGVIPEGRREAVEAALKLHMEALGGPVASNEPAVTRAIGGAAV